MTVVGNLDSADAADLFAPASRRERVVEWQAPGPVAKAAAAMSGLDAMRGIRDGILPPPPMARLIGFRMRVAEPGRIVMELEPHQALENTIGLLHGATAAAQPLAPDSVEPLPGRSAGVCRAWMAVRRPPPPSHQLAYTRP